MTAASINEGSEVRIATAMDEQITSFRVDAPVEKGDPKWSNYLRGVVRGFQERGHHIPGFDAYIVSSIPAGTGLSSPAALERAATRALDQPGCAPDLAPKKKRDPLPDPAL